MTLGFCPYLWSRGSSDQPLVSTYKWGHLTHLMDNFLLIWIWTLIGKSTFNIIQFHDYDFFHVAPWTYFQPLCTSSEHNQNFCSAPRNNLNHKDWWKCEADVFVISTKFNKRTKYYTKLWNCLHILIFQIIFFF